MSETAGQIVQSDVASAEFAEAPPIPAGYHLAAAALSADRLRCLAETLALAIERSPADEATILDLQGAALNAWCNASDHYGAYRALLECRGQA